jgi:hypothetical protein
MHSKIMIDVLTSFQSCRDFSNGFLVAEILSKYFPADVSMHSFEDGASQAQKQANWSLIARFLASQGITLTDASQTAIMAQDQAAVENFLQNLHLYASIARLSPRSTIVYTFILYRMLCRLVSDAEAVQMSHHNDTDFIDTPGHGSQISVQSNGLPSWAQAAATHAM